MANNRIYYASQTAQLQPQNSEGTSKFSYWYQPIGLQSVNMTTTFNLQQAFQLGTVELYDNVENVPNIEVTMAKVIDTTAPLYCMAMGGANGVDGALGKDMASLSTNRVNFRLGIYSDQQQNITNAASSYVWCSGMYLSRFNYTIPVEGNGTEEITLVGNHKIWNSGVGFNASSVFSPSTTNVGGINPNETSGILTRQYVNLQTSTLPIGSGGIAGTSPHLQNITVSADLGRENINELGRFNPYCRYTTFPIEVTSEFEVVSTRGDNVDVSSFYAADFCQQTLKTNLFQKTIAININRDCSNGMILDLGNKNTLTSVNQTGGDTGGGNVTVTYSFRNFNSFRILASGTYADGVAVSVASGDISAQSEAISSNSDYSLETNSSPNYYGDDNNV